MKLEDVNYAFDKNLNHIFQRGKQRGKEAYGGQPGCDIHYHISLSPISHFGVYLGFFHFLHADTLNACVHCGKGKGREKGGEKERGKGRKGKREGGTAGIHTVSGKMARWMNRIQRANKCLIVHGPSEAQFLTGKVF